MTAKKNIDILRVTYLRGPNIWTYRPVIEAWLDIGSLEDHPSNTLPGFYERLTAWLPGLAVIACASVLTAPLGAKVAHAMNVAQLKKAFALVLYLLAAYMASRALA